MTFKVLDSKVIELSEKYSEEDDESSDEEEIEQEEYIFRAEDNEPGDLDVERRVFLLPPCLMENTFKYGFELFAEDFISQQFQETDNDVVKIDSDYIAMKPIPKMSEFEVSKEVSDDRLSQSLDCRKTSVVESLKAKWKGSFWTQKLVILITLLLLEYRMIVIILAVTFGPTKKDSY